MLERQRINRLESKVEAIDKRQESFETFVKAHIERLDKTIAKMDERMNRMEDKLDNISRHVQGLTIAAMVGIGAMSISIVAFVAVAIYKS